MTNTPAAPSIEQLEGASAYVRAAGLKLSEASGSKVVGWIDLTAEHHQPFGIVHGGVYCSAIETAASIGASTAVMDQGLVAVGVNNNTNFLAQMTEGRVDVVATPVTQGRTQQLWNVEITRPTDGRLVATGQVRLQNIQPR
jgi:1,4-dihydroxy-2-naphthoyl-CoA hydrolase